MSARADVAAEVAAFLHATPERWSAPYGILDGKQVKQSADGKLRSVRCITFGVARYLDATITIYSPSYLHLRSSRTGGHRFTTAAALLDYLRSTPLP